METGRTEKWVLEREREKSWRSTHLRNKREQLGCVAITTNSAGHLLACVCVCETERVEQADMCVCVPVSSAGGE